MSGIEIKATPAEKIPVTLVGKEYEITPPKTALAMKMAIQSKLFEDDPEKIVDALNEWTVKAFGKSVNEKIQKRLDDENDDLDIPHIMELMEKVVEYQTEGNPTS